MMILMRLPIIDHITNKQNGETIGLVPIDLVTIKTITEDDETGYATIHYKGSPKLVTSTPFIELLDVFNRQGIVEFSGLKRCLKVSKPLNDYIKELENK